MNINGNNPVQSRLSLHGPPARKTLPALPFQDIGCVRNVDFVDADIAVGMEEIAINLNTQLGRKLKEMESGLSDFTILSRSVARLDR